MVKLTVDVVTRCTSGFCRQSRDESLVRYLKRLTHLYLENKNIDDVGDGLSACENLCVLYLYDNRLEKMPVLSHNHNLTHLYLQNNNITKMEHLHPLTALNKLYLAGNSIAVVEGLEGLDQLQELHLENQKISPGEKLSFDARSIQAVTFSLQVLNVSGNGLWSLVDLEPLVFLTHLSASNNELEDITELIRLLGAWRRLKRLDLSQNPVCRLPKYRDRVIVMANSIESLDGKPVTETMRLFLKNWQTNKDLPRRPDTTGRQDATGRTDTTIDLVHCPPLRVPNIYTEYNPQYGDHRDCNQKVKLSRSMSTHGISLGPSAVNLPVLPARQRTMPLRLSRASSNPLSHRLSNMQDETTGRMSCRNETVSEVKTSILSTIRL